MKAKIKELSGKYYGTEISILNDKSESIIKVWTGIDYNPSERELTRCYGCNSENKYGDPCRECFCDSHYESQTDYELAKVICKAISEHTFI